MSEMADRSESVVAQNGELFAEQAEAERRQLLLFEACGESFALPLELVREVQPLERIIRVPNAPAEVLGILNLRGRAHTVFDLGACLSLPADPRPPTHLVVLDLGDADLRIGLVAQTIGQVQSVAVSEIGPPPQGEAGEGGLSGVFELKGQVVGVLDLWRAMARFFAEWGVKATERGAS